MALVVLGMAAAPVSAEPFARIAQADQGADGAPADGADTTTQPGSPPADKPQPSADAPASQAPDTSPPPADKPEPSGDAPPPQAPEVSTPPADKPDASQAPEASPPPKQSDAELETITVKPSRKAPRKAAAAPKPTPGASSGAPGGEPSVGPTTTTGPTISLPESAFGPVDGFVATRSATGIKTDTPIVEIPQSISVITADRMEQLRATTLNEALNYTAGVRPNVYGSDSRYDWLSIRGFDAYFPGFYFDGLFARNNNTWAVWRVEPYGAERIEVLKGPSSVLYGQTNPGGLINVVTKRPTEQPMREVEMLFGNRDQLQPAFDIGDKVTEDGKVRYRLTGLGLTADTDVDFADRNEFFIRARRDLATFCRYEPDRPRPVYPLQFGYRHHVSPGGGVAPAQSERLGTPEHQSR
jgi:iron complex outermembrane receptor protein